MKVSLRWVAALALVVVTLRPALPVAARPKDPDSFRVTRRRVPVCQHGASFRDPFPGACSADFAGWVTYWPAFWQTTELANYCADPWTRQAVYSRNAASASTGPGDRLRV
jgi:hypothetical protein